MDRNQERRNAGPMNANLMDQVPDVGTRSDVTFTVTFTVAAMDASNDQRADVVAWLEAVLEAASDDLPLTDQDVSYRLASGISSVSRG